LLENACLSDEVEGRILLQDDVSRKVAMEIASTVDMSESRTQVREDFQ
jgi:hypothetical protein